MEALPAMIAGRMASVTPLFDGLLLRQVCLPLPGRSAGDQTLHADCARPLPFSTARACAAYAVR